MLDAPFVPTDDAMVEIMLDLAKVGPKDILYDLGSGDGRILITAAKKWGTRGIGVELDPLRVADAMEDCALQRVEHLVDFVEENLFTVDFSEATVVTLYLLDSINAELRPRLLSELQPGTRIVSHAFDMGDWKADDQIELSGVTIYKWVVPAQIAGSWEWEGINGESYYIELQQKYQEVTGNAWLDDEPVALKNLRLDGNCLELEIQSDNNTAPNCFTLYFENNALQSVLDHS